MIQRIQFHMSSMTYRHSISLGNEKSGTEGRIMDCQLIKCLGNLSLTQEFSHICSPVSVFKIYSQKAGLISIPMAGQCLANATCMVVPAPTNGSRTTPPGGQPMSKQRATSSSGKDALSTFPLFLDRAAIVQTSSSTLLSTRCFRSK